MVDIFNFRVWENNKKYIFNLKDLLNVRTTVGHGYTDFPPMHNDIIIQQSTGLVDFYKKEVFEGDIVNLFAGYSGNIPVHKILVIKRINHRFVLDDVLPMDCLDESKIVGNIIENPEGTWSTDDYLNKFKWKDIEYINKPFNDHHLMIIPNYIK